MSRVGTDQALALVRDITERKQAEERIQRSELLLRTVFNSVYDGIFLHTAEGAIVDVNDKILEMYGVSREEATRLSIADDYSSPDNPLDQLGVLWQQAMAGHPQLFEWKAKRPHDGTTFDAEVFLRRVTLGGRDMVLANVRDITERKQAEAAVAGERDFSNALINSLPVIFYLYDQAGSLVRWNRRYAEMLGYTPAEMSQVKVLDTIAEQDRALIVARMNEVFTTGYAEAEARLLSKEGRQVPYLLTGTRLAVGDQVYLVGAGIDLTERKRAEAQRERFVTQLSTAAEISAQVGAILDTDELLDEVIPLLKERFDLYHVHFYVMDEARQELVLRAGYGQVGRIMRQQGFKITLDQEQSLVARAARTRQIALANDVTQDPDFMPNLLLPDTRAEVAVPAMIGDRLLGVFDVQSDQADYFTESDLDVYRTLAGQIANAFQSARLFEQQRQAEAAQREAAEKIRAMFDAMTEGITVTNMMGKIEDLNEATLRHYGYSGRDDLLGRSSMQLFTRPFWSRAAESVRRALETGTSQTAEYRMVRRDGSEFEAEMNAALLRDATGAPSGFVSIIRDITARKRAEEERARLTAQLRTAADISTQVASILDPQALFSRVVSLIKERFDIYHVQVYVVDEETQELVLQAGYGEPGRVMVARGHRIPLNTERSLVARAARTREVVVVDDVTKAPDHLPNPLLPLTRSEVAVPAIYGDRVLGVFDVQDDEPARFGPAELDVFRTLAGQIATAFQNAGYVEELQHVAERFRELDRAKSEFLANMSHELRTPLNSIIGYAEVLLMGIDGELEGDTLEDVKAIHENGQHLLSMINDVLDLAKIEAGRMVLKMEEVEVDQLLDEVKSSGTGLLRKYQRTEAVELRISSEPDLPLLHADRIRLNQVLNNLISNAMKFTEHGYVQVRAYRSDPWVCIEVADSGIGIPANQLEQIFEKFRQVDGSSKRRAEGTGLGLAITRYLVEMHGGTIEVSSELGKGSVFTVRLPIQTAPADPEGGAG
jgi:PAS domain S-box-containing protein